MSVDKDYLGDGVHVDHDGFHIVLTTENGVETTNTVYLDPNVWINLKLWVERVEKQHA